jgi:hypothetical protein
MPSAEEQHNEHKQSEKQTSKNLLARDLHFC